MAEIVAPIADKVIDCLVDPVVRQLGYVFNNRTNIEDLSEKFEMLKDTMARLQHSVDEALRNGHMIEDDVRKWFARADSFIQDAGKFLEDEKSVRKSCLNGLCPNLESRRRLGREAMRRAGVALQIHGDGHHFGRVSYVPPLQRTSSAFGNAPNDSSEALESRISILGEIMEALKDATLNRIGVWGLGGVGKTRLVNHVAEKAERDNLFHKVVTASVFQTPDYKRIQQHLADQLGMRFEEVSDQGRADRLRDRMKKEKTILVILDDLWGEVELKKIGVPSPDDHKGCKLLLTSRNSDVLSNQMATQKHFKVEHLQQNEAWILFKNTAGDSIKKSDFEAVAMDITKECAGLPLAIVTVATALKNKSLSIWEDALLQLKTQTSTNISGMETKVYSSLKLSYDYLEGDEVKSFFLLCGLIFNYIHISDLLKYGVDLRLFQELITLEEARNRIGTLVDKLKASNLLLDSVDSAVVTIHDLIRNVAIEVASKQHHALTYQNGARVEEWPKIDDLQKFTMRDVYVSEFPEGLVCSKLQLLGCYGLYMLWKSQTHFLKG